MSSVARTVVQVSPEIEKKFLAEAQKGGICWDCVFKAVGGKAIRSGNDSFAALKDLGYKITSSPKSNDIAIFIDSRSGQVRHVAFYAGNSPQTTFLSNNVATGGNSLEAPGYYTLSQLQKLDSGLKDVVIQYFTR